jgi:hypothetical protein
MGLDRRIRDIEQRRASGTAYVVLHARDGEEDRVEAEYRELFDDEISLVIIVRKFYDGAVTSSTPVSRGTWASSRALRRQ